MQVKVEFECKEHSRLPLSWQSEDGPQDSAGPSRLSFN